MKERGNVDYFKQLEGFYLKAQADDRISSIEVCLYATLLFKWNKFFFNSPLRVIRKEIIRLSKVSHDTYGISLKRLEDAGFIKYKKGCNDKSLAEIIIIPLNQSPQLPKADINEKYSTPAIPDSLLSNPDFRNAAIPNSGPFIKHENKKHLKQNNAFEKRFSDENQTEGQAAIPDMGQLLDTYYSNPNPIESLIPTTNEVENYFNAKGFDKSHAKNFYAFNQKRNWSFSNESKDWRFFADKWISKNSKEKNNVRHENVSHQDIQSLFNDFLEKKNILHRILPEHFQLLKLELTKEVQELAINKRFDELMTSNKNHDSLLAEAYLKGDYTNEAIIKDQPNLHLLSQKTAIVLYFKTLQAKDITQIPPRQ